MKIKILKAAYQLDIKRCYLPILIEVFCPKCKTVCKQDINDNYLSYPTLNGIEELIFCCESEDCEYEFSKSIEIGLTVKEVPNE